MKFHDVAATEIWSPPSPGRQARQPEREPARQPRPPARAVARANSDRCTKAKYCPLRLAKPALSAVDRFRSIELTASAACRLWHCQREEGRSAAATVQPLRLPPRDRGGQTRSGPCPCPGPRACPSCPSARGCCG